MNVVASQTDLGEQSHSALVIEPDVKAQREIVRVLRTAVTNVQVCGSLEELTTNSRWDVMLVNYDSLSDVERMAIGNVARLLKVRGRLVMCSARRLKSELGDLLDKVGLTNFIAWNERVAPHELLVTVRKLLANDIFGIDKYFPWGSKTWTRTVRSSAEKQAVLDAAATIASELAIPSRLGRCLATATDELVSNALYNGPVDEAGDRLYALLPRSQEVELQPGEEIEITFCSDGKSVGVSVRDPFGSLQADAVVEYLAKCFRVDMLTISARSGGSGIGLYQAFEAVSKLVINIKPRAATEIIGIINVQGTYRDFVSDGKSLNVFVHQSPDGD